MSLISNSGQSLSKLGLITFAAGLFAFWAYKKCTNATDKKASTEAQKAFTHLKMTHEIDEKRDLQSRPLHLFLNFDVNKTLILADAVKNFGPEDMINSVLAEDTVDVWNKKYPAMPFKRYIYAVILERECKGHQKQKTTDVIKRQQQSAAANFMRWLTDNDHPAKERVTKKYNEIIAKFTVFTDPKTKQVKFGVFKSYYVLLNKLRKLNISFGTALRTFGTDLKEVTEEIEKNPDGVKFTRSGKFKATHLHLDGESVLSEPGAIFDRVIKSSEHFKIQDEREPWVASGEKSFAGKPHIFDSTGTKHDVCYISLIFDDNITGKEEDIVAPVDISKANIPSKQLLDRILFTVNPIQAAMDDNYFVKPVANALTHYGYHDLAQKLLS